MYGSFVENSQNLDRPALKFLINCVFEIVNGLNNEFQSMCYKTIFNSVKKLALQLRSAIKVTTKVSF